MTVLIFQAQADGKAAKKASQFRCLLLNFKIQLSSVDLSTHTTTPMVVRYFVAVIVDQSRMCVFSPQFVQSLYFFFIRYQNCTLLKGEAVAFPAKERIRNGIEPKTGHSQAFPITPRGSRDRGDGEEECFRANLARGWDWWENYAKFMRYHSHCGAHYYVVYCAAHTGIRLPGRWVGIPFPGGTAKRLRRFLLPGGVSPAANI